MSSSVLVLSLVLLYSGSGAKKTSSEGDGNLQGTRMNSYWRAPKYSSMKHPEATSFYKSPMSRSNMVNINSGKEITQPIQDPSGRETSDGEATIHEWLVSKALATEVPEENKPKLQMLKETLQQIHQVAGSNATNETLLELCSIFGQFENLARQPSDDPDAESTSVSMIEQEIVQATRKMASLPWSFFVGSDPPRFAAGGVFKMFYNHPLTNDHTDFLGSLVYSAGGFNLSLMCTVGDYKRYAGFVIYPENNRSLLTLPEINFPVTKIQVVDIILIQIVPFSGIICYEEDYFDMAILRWFPQSYVANLKYVCAYWDESRSSWSSDMCVIVRTTGFPRNVSCFCDMRKNGNFTEYVLLEYEEDLAAFLQIDYSRVPAILYPTNSSELKKYEDLIGDVASNTYNSPNELIEIFMSRLKIVMAFDSETLTNSSNDKLIEDVGKIIGKLIPEGDGSVIGRHSATLTAYAINLATYDNDPPLGFGLYHNFSIGIEYFRSKEEIDFNFLFSLQMNYSLLFSKSVVDDNSRLVFLLYPPNQFFKSAAVIDGNKVLFMRVLDVVMVPNQNSAEDQFINMFYGAKNDTLFGCAFWSPLEKQWTSTNCFANSNFFHGVCTCNMSANFQESRTRGQYIIYKYSGEEMGAYNIRIVGEPEDHQALTTVSVLGVHALSKYPLDHPTVERAIIMLNNIFVKPVEDFNYKVKKSVVRKVIEDVRNLVVASRCKGFNFQTLGLLTFMALCSEEETSADYVLDNDDIRKPVAFIYNEIFMNIIPMCSYSDAFVFREEQAFILHVPNTIVNLTTRYAFLLYPKDATVLPLPSIGYQIVSSRVVDVILMSSKDTQDGELFVELSFDRSDMLTLGCSFWDVEQDAWKPNACPIVQRNFLFVCNCSLSANTNMSLSGGRYITYRHTNRTFDNKVYLDFGAESFTDADKVFARGAELIHNASLLPLNATMVYKIVHVYHKMLKNIDVAGNSSSTMTRVLVDIDRSFSHFYEDTNVPVHLVFTKILDTWNLKSSEVNNDLFSNAVLSAKDEVPTISQMSVVVNGHTKGRSELTQHLDEMFFQVYGVYFSRKESQDVLLLRTRSLDQVIAKDPTFACFINGIDPIGFLHEHRVIYLVYPMNVSPFPYTMTKLPMFNSRQIDLFVDFSLSSSDYYMFYENTGAISAEVYFQPVENPKEYIKIGCASWDINSNAWTNAGCKMNLLSNLVSCTCYIMDHNVSRIIIYEYTELKNFSLVTLFDGVKVVFLLGSSFALCGFIGITITAILFPTWRQERSNKILLQLATSSFFYLILTMFRETHIIFAELKRINIPLIAFVILVHYTRLVHYIWGLVMSVLQYRKFSSVVGASSTPHLLLKISLTAWGVPLVPLAILLVWNQQLHFCTPDKLTHYILYLVPVLGITLLNIGLLTAVIRNMTNGCGFWDDEELKKHGGSGGDVLMRQLKQTIMMFFLFGIPTVFEMFNDLGFHSVVLDYINKILDPIQGVVLFLYFVLMDNKARACWLLLLFGEKVVVDKGKATKPLPFKVKTPKKPITNLEVSVAKIDKKVVKGKSTTPKKNKVKTPKIPLTKAAVSDANDITQKNNEPDAIEVDDLESDPQEIKIIATVAVPGDYAVQYVVHSENRKGRGVHACTDTEFKVVDKAVSVCGCCRPGKEIRDQGSQTCSPEVEDELTAA